MSDKIPNHPLPLPSAAATHSRLGRNWKKAAIWLTGPTAILVFVNELTNFTQFFKSMLADSKPAAVVEQREASASPDANQAPKKLAIEAARFDEQDPNKVDLVCRNPAAESAFIRAATVELVRVWRLQPVVANRGKLASSAEYTLTLPAENGPSTIEKELSQEIPAKGLDRFSITVGPAASKESSAKVYCFRLSLQFGGETIPAGDFLLMISPSPGTPQPTVAANRKMVAEILQTPGIKNSVLTNFLASAPAE